MSLTVTSALLSFSAAAALLTVTPGLDTALVLRTAVVEGRRDAAEAGLGVSLGVLAWGVMASAGLGAVATASPRLYGGIQFAGSIYLVWLGLGMLRAAFRGAGEADVAGSAAAGGRGRWLLKGVLTNLLNPKVGLFYVSLLPQFTPPGVNAAAFGVLLACIHVAMGMIWFCALILSTRSLGARLTSPRVKRTLDGLTGSVLLAFGARLFMMRGA